ncbi:MAG: hypothetical protein AB1592_17565 [Pseudomonadota bacterium]
MWRFMVGLGLLLALAGLVIVALGVAIFVSSFGNTLIATGAVLISGGIVLAAVGIVLRHLLDLSDRLEAALAGGALAAARPVDYADEDFASEPRDLEREDEADDLYEDEEPEAPALPPRSYVPPSFARQPAPERAPAAPEPYRPEPPRMDPSRAEAGRPDFAPPARPEPPRAESSRPDLPRTEQTGLPEALQRGRVLGRTPEGESFAARLRPQPPVPQPPAGAPEEEMERAPERPMERPVERAPLVTRPFTPPSRRPDAAGAPAGLPPVGAPPMSAPPMSAPPMSAPPMSAPPMAPPPPPSAPGAAGEPSVLKSGVVGGMAYTLYSDGSIQAELPDGTLRFKSLQELRDHVARSQG